MHTGQVGRSGLVQAPLPRPSRWVATSANPSWLKLLLRVWMPLLSKNVELGNLEDTTSARVCETRACRIGGGPRIVWFGAKAFSHCQSVGRNHLISAMMASREEKTVERAARTNSKKRRASE